MKPGFLAPIISIAVGVVLAAAPPRKSPVITRGFTGTYIEDLEFVERGPFANHLIAVEGDGIYGAPLPAAGRGALRKLVDFRGVLTVLPRGIAYIETERAFVVLDGSACTNLVLFDAGSGRMSGRRTIQHLNGFAPGYCEGLAAIPPSSPQFDGDLLVAAMDTAASTARIEVVRPDGQVVQEIIPPQPAASNVISGISFQSPDTIVAGVTYNNGAPAQLWTLSLAGVEIAPRVTLNQGIIEGIAHAPDGRVFVTGLRADIHAFDLSLQPLPSGDRDYQLGLGWIAPRGIAWDSSIQRLLVNVAPADGAAQFRSVHALSPSFDAAPVVFDFSISGTPGAPQSLTYLPGENLVGLANSQALAARRRLYLFGGGAPAGAVTFGDPAVRPLKVEYLPATNEFAVRTAVDATKVGIYTRTGAFVRQFDPRPAGVDSVGSFAFFTTAEGAERLLFLMSNDQAVVTDLSGSAISTFNWRTTLGIIEPNDLASFTSGPYAGAFAVTETSPGSVTIFRLP